MRNMVDHVDLRYVVYDNLLVDKKCLKSLRPCTDGLPTMTDRSVIHQNSVTCSLLAESCETFRVFLAWDRPVCHRWQPIRTGPKIQLNVD